jgi:hypothetical protein
MLMGWLFLLSGDPLPPGDHVRTRSFEGHRRSFPPTL